MYFKTRLIKNVSPRLDVLQALALVGLSDLGKRLLRRAGEELAPEELQRLTSRVQQLGEVPDGLRLAMALYAIRECLKCS